MHGFRRRLMHGASREPSHFFGTKRICPEESAQVHFRRALPSRKFIYFSCILSSCPSPDRQIATQKPVGKPRKPSIAIRYARITCRWTFRRRLSYFCFQLCITRIIYEMRSEEGHQKYDILCFLKITKSCTIRHIESMSRKNPAMLVSQSAKSAGADLQKICFKASVIMSESYTRHQPICKYRRHTRLPSRSTITKVSGARC